jgi:hypothetical protein
MKVKIMSIFNLFFILITFSINLFASDIESNSKIMRKQLMLFNIVALSNTEPEIIFKSGISSDSENQSDPKTPIKISKSNIFSDLQDTVRKKENLIINQMEFVEIATPKDKTQTPQKQDRSSRSRSGNKENKTPSKSSDQDQFSTPKKDKQNDNKNLFSTVKKKIADDDCTQYAKYSICKSQNYKNRLSPNSKLVDEDQKTTIYVIYLLYSANDNKPYIGRTSIDNANPNNMDDAIKALKKRYNNHKMIERGFNRSRIYYITTSWDASRGAEQTLIDSMGGAKSVGGTSNNTIKGIRDKNPRKNGYESAFKDRGYKTPEKDKK